MSETDSSLTFAFYIDSARAFEDFQQRIEGNKEALQGAIFMKKSSPAYMLTPATVDSSLEFIEIS
jgi:hypothetical protein